MRPPPYARIPEKLTPPEYPRRIEQFLIKID
jgi:hypothetical protein